MAFLRWLLLNDLSPASWDPSQYVQRNHGPRDKNAGHALVNKVAVEVVCTYMMRTGEVRY